jgi:hypothetical protein
MHLQPSGLSLAADGGALFVADSESSTVRSCDLGTGGGRPHVGGDKLFADNLFRFGDRRACMHAHAANSTACMQLHIALLAGCLVLVLISVKGAAK